MSGHDHGRASGKIEAYAQIDRGRRNGLLKDVARLPHDVESVAEERDGQFHRKTRQRRAWQPPASPHPALGCDPGASPGGQRSERKDDGVNLASQPQDAWPQLRAAARHEVDGRRLRPPAPESPKAKPPSLVRCSGHSIPVRTPWRR